MSKGKSKWRIYRGGGGGGDGGGDLRKSNEPWSHFHICFMHSNVFESYIFLAVEKCYHVESKGQDYAGFESVTADGIICQRWDTMYPMPHSFVSFAGGKENISQAENRCRNPSTKEKPWCYHAIRRGWSYCDVPPCVGKLKKLGVGVVVASEWRKQIFPLQGSAYGTKSVSLTIYGSHI